MKKANLEEESQKKGGVFQNPYLLQRDMIKSIEWKATWKMRFIMFFFRTSFDLLDQFKIELKDKGE